MVIQSGRRQRRLPATPAIVSGALLGNDVIGPFRSESTIAVMRWCRILSARSPDGTRVAIKLFEPNERVEGVVSNAGKTAWRRRFEQEAWLLSEITHPNIMPLISRGLHRDGRPFLVMPYCPANLIGEIGGDLDGEDRIARLAPVRRPRPLDPRRAVSLLRQILRGLSALHALGVVHRDMKPGNILLTHRRNGRVRISDLGMAAVNGHRLDVAGEGIGTRGYAAPELIADPRVTDPRIDVYSVGVIGFRMFTGRRPSEDERDPSMLVPLSADIAAVISQALSSEQGPRQANAMAMLTQLEAAI